MTQKEPGKVYGRRTLRREPARTVPEPKEGGLAGSARDAIARGSVALYGKMTEHGPGWLMPLRETGHAMSGASATNFHGMEEEGSPVPREETVKGGRRPIRGSAPHAAEEAYKEWLRRLDAALDKLEGRA